MDTSTYDRTSDASKDPTRNAARMIARSRGLDWSSMSQEDRGVILKEVRIVARALESAKGTTTSS